jgi:hypothetical protein
MLQCQPKSICSCDFYVYGLSVGGADTEYNWFTEQGRIIIAEDIFEVKKQSIFLGHWTYEQHGRVIADAQKPSAFFRTFDISYGSEGQSITLQAVSAFSRVFEIISEGRVVGSIAPAHPFTRRATIECSDSIPENIQLFAFWLAVITWKRSARNSNQT